MHPDLTSDEALWLEINLAGCENFAGRLMAIGRAYAELPDSGATPEQILGYDEDGLPT